MKLLLHSEVPYQKHAENLTPQAHLTVMSDRQPDSVQILSLQKEADFRQQQLQKNQIQLQTQVIINRSQTELRKEQSLLNPL